MRATFFSSSAIRLIFTAAVSCLLTTLFISHSKYSLQRISRPASSSHSTHQHPIQDTPAFHLRRYTAEKCGDSNILYDERHNTCQDMVPVVASQAMYAVHTEDTNLIACVPPKNSCTLHKSLLQRTRGVRDYESTGNVHGQGSANLRLSSWTSEHIGQAFQNLSMPKYAIIKNPMARTLSGYLSKVEKFAPKDQRTVEDYKKWAYDVFPKGSGRNRDWSRVNPHWRPQSTFCGFRAFNLHEHFHMFRFEQPHTFVDFIYEHIPARYLDSGWGVKLRLNVSFSDYVLSPAVREVRGTKSADKKFEYYRDLDFFDHMAEELRDDIILLGYDDDVRSLREKIVELNEAEKGGKIKAVVRSLMTRYMKFADSFAKHSGIR